jgi:hypothetical protein
MVSLSDSGMDGSLEYQPYLVNPRRSPVEMSKGLPVDAVSRRAQWCCSHAQIYAPVSLCYVGGLLHTKERLSPQQYKLS